MKKTKKLFLKDHVKNDKNLSLNKSEIKIIWLKDECVIMCLWQF